MVADRTDITTAVEYDDAYGFSIGIPKFNVTLAYSIGQSKGNAHWDYEYHTKILTNITIDIAYEIKCGISIIIFRYDHDSWWF